jgi:hypothetical protein
MDVGTDVILTGLKARDDLNGKLGKVVAQANERGRVGVRMHGSNEALGVKPENLMLATEDAVKQASIEHVAAMGKALQDPDLPPIEQFVIVNGKADSDLGYLPMRMIAAKHNGRLADVVQIVAATLDSPADSSRHAKLVEDAIAQGRSKIARLAKQLDTSKQADRTDGVMSLYSALMPVLLLLFARGLAEHGPGIIAIEVNGTLQQALRGLLGKAWPPVVATYLTHEQSKVWYSETIRASKGKAAARQIAEQQVQSNTLQMASANAAWASVVTSDLLPVTVGTKNSLMPTRALAESSKGIFQSIGLHDAQVMRFNSPTDVQAFDIFGALDFAGGKITPRTSSRSTQHFVDPKGNTISMGGVDKAVAGAGQTVELSEEELNGMRADLVEKVADVQLD